MAVTSPDNIWTPDSGDEYALTVDLAAMADTVQDALNLRGTLVVSDLDDLNAVVSPPPGGVAVVLALGGAQFIRNAGGTAWVQISEARFASAATRDTEYAKAAGAYKVEGAEVYRTDKRWSERWYALPTNPGFYPVPGTDIFATFVFNANAPNATEFNTGTATYPWNAAFTEDAEGWNAVGSPSVIPNIRGRYEAEANVLFGAASNSLYRIVRNIGIYASQGSITVGTPGGSGSGRISNVVMNGSTDSFALSLYQTTGGLTATDCRLTVRYLGPPTA